MATNRNDEMDRNKTNTPQGSTSDRNTSQGSTSQGSQGGMNRNPSTPNTPNTPSPSGSTSQGTLSQAVPDAVNRDREMNRDTKVGQGSSGSGQSGRDSFGSTDRKPTSDTSSRDSGRGPEDISE